MRRQSFRIAAGCILAMIGLRPLFSLDPSPASGYKVIYSFTGGADGGYPLSDLILDPSGNLYGTTSQGGSGTTCTGGCGTVFALHRTKDGWQERVLYSFAGGSDGAGPEAGVVFDKPGNLYGTTARGGAADSGTVFKLTPNLHDGWTESVLYRFSCGSDGCGPRTDLVFDGRGNLYGTTSAGGDYRCYKGEDNCGTVFELTSQRDGSWKVARSYDFAGGNDGILPYSPVVLDSAGSVYGQTEFGGRGPCAYTTTFPGCGVVYKLTPNSDGSWAESIIYGFAGGGGFAVIPSGGLIVDNPSRLFGTSLAGGDGLGTLFELKQQKESWTQSILYRFYGMPDGAKPVGKVEMDKDGVFRGVTSVGGKNRDGTVFEVKRSGTHRWKETVLHNFAGGTDGLKPQSGIVSDGHGHLFGTTPQGGNSGCYNGMGCGTVYEVIP